MFLWDNLANNSFCTDAETIGGCDLKMAILDGSVEFPEDEPLPGEDRHLLYFLIGDDAFAL